MIERMNRFKQLDLIVNWMLSIFFCFTSRGKFFVRAATISSTVTRASNWAFSTSKIFSGFQTSYDSYWSVRNGA